MVFLTHGCHTERGFGHKSEAFTTTYREKCCERWDGKYMERLYLRGSSVTDMKRHSGN